MKKLTVFLMVVLFAAGASAQEKPMRVGLKFGVPMIVGLNAEYVTPAVGGRLAPSADLSYFSISLGEAETSFSYIEIGSNIYFKDTGKGFYGNLSYGRIGLKASYSDPDAGDGEGKIGINLVNLKLGAKLGNSFYFRPELGYAIGVGGTSKVKVEYADGTTQEEDVPGLVGGGFVINLGFGFAF